MNYIWAGMLLIGIIFATFRGILDTFSHNLLESCNRGVFFVLGLTGIMATWSGLMNVANKSGLIDIFAKFVSPAMKFLFPGKLKKETIAMMLMSFSTNLFGAGNSATVFSLKSMAMLDSENGGSPVASDAMCMFMAVNMSMVQIVPVTIIKILTDSGSSNPEGIIIPSIIAGLVSMAASILVCKFYERAKK